MAVESAERPNGSLTSAGAAFRARHRPESEVQ